MNNDKNYIDSMTTRYVYAATRWMPAKQRKDAARELESLIGDMMEERTGGRVAVAKDIEMVLTELGNPSAFSAKANGQEQYLIGPDLFPKYKTVISIVMMAVAFGITVAMVVLMALGSFSGIFDFLFSWLSSLVSAIVTSAAIVTFIFALAQWRGGALRDGILHTPWSPANLPPLPQNGERIPRWESIFGIVFGVLAMLLFVLFPQLIGGFFKTDGRYVLVPFFNLEIMRQMLPMLLLMFALGIFREFVAFMEGRYTMRLAIVTSISDLISMGLAVVVFGNPQLYSANFFPAVQAVAPELSEISWVFESFGKIFLAVFLFALVLDLLTTLFKALKYRANV